MRDRTPTGSATGSSPKTRTEPLSARSRPRTCLMSVVFPAPLAPTRPYTAPRGIDKLTESSAVFESKRRVSSVTSMTGSPTRVASAVIQCGNNGSWLTVNSNETCRNRRDRSHRHIPYPAACQRRPRRNRRQSWKARPVRAAACMERSPADRDRPGGGGRSKDVRRANSVTRGGCGRRSHLLYSNQRAAVGGRITTAAHPPAPLWHNVGARAHNDCAHDRRRASTSVRRLRNPESRHRTTAARRYSARRCARRDSASGAHGGSGLESAQP